MDRTVNAVAVTPGVAHSLHLYRAPLPPLGPGDVLVRPRQVGVCGTDREIIEAGFGAAPAGETSLVLGHEVLGVVEDVGGAVASVRPGDLVSATVRRPDGCPACLAGQPDMCQWLTYDERGILRAHGFMAERFVEAEGYLVPVPASLAETGVLLEPLSVVEKAYRQASLTQRRITSWSANTAVVLGAGPIGLLQTMLLRERGAEVWTLARSAAPTGASRVVEACGAHYVSTADQTVTALAATLPPIDMIVEATGVSALVAECMAALGANGVLVLLSITGQDAMTSVPLDAINRGFVLGNKVMIGSVNSAHEDFSSGVERLARFETLWPGLAGSLITHRLAGLDRAAAAIAERTGIKTVVELPD